MHSIDLTAMLRKGLEAGNRPDDGLLHCSSDIIGPLRHTMLRLAGAPTKPEGIASMIRLQTGTLWHSWLDSLVSSSVEMSEHEVTVDKGLPYGWGGTADTLIYDDGLWTLYDYKTTKGEGLQYILRDGAKPEHIAQVSAYLWALAEMGIPMADRAYIWYIPMNEVYGGDPVEPTLQEIVPLPKEELWAKMLTRADQVADYLNMVEDEGIVNLLLASVEPRIQKLRKKGPIWELILQPHWSAMFCPYEDSLCDCSAAGTTKIGQWVQLEDGWIYEPRDGFDLTTPELAPKGAVL